MSTRSDSSTDKEASDTGDIRVQANVHSDEGLGTTSKVRTMRGHTLARDRAASGPGVSIPKETREADSVGDYVKGRVAQSPASAGSDAQLGSPIGPLTAHQWVQVAFQRLFGRKSTHVSRNPAFLVINPTEFHQVLMDVIESAQKDVEGNLR